MKIFKSCLVLILSIWFQSIALWAEAVDGEPFQRVIDAAQNQAEESDCDGYGCPFDLGLS